MPIRITFLFGSGADSDYCETMPSGKAFTRALLKEEGKKARKMMLGEECANLYLVTYNSRKFFLQTIDANQEEATKLLGEQIVRQCLLFYDPNGDVTDNSQNADIIHEWCREWYYYATDNPAGYSGTPVFLEKANEIRDFFGEKGLFFDTLDEKFNSLRFPERSNKAKRVKNAYAAIFILMISKLYALNEKYDKWEYSDLFELLQTEYRCCKRKPETYYDLISNYANDESLHFVTTNYTKLAENCIQPKNPMIYLHGKLTWFEDLEKLTVYDVADRTERTYANEAADNGKLVPFILVPSGVKPLICSRQIEEFHNFIEALESSNELCIIGYRFNSEDNHVNAIIGDWLRQNKQHRLIYFNFNGDVNFSTLKWVKEFSYKTKPEIASIDSENIQIVSIPIDKSNAEQKLKEYLDIRRKSK